VVFIVGLTSVKGLCIVGDSARINLLKPNEDEREVSYL
jgi:hypothetical protein